MHILTGEHRPNKMREHMSTNNKFNRTRIVKPGRFTATIDCADNLTDDEIIRMQAAIEAKVCLLQKQTRGYKPEHVGAL
jgi:hypothetical protein